MATSSFSKSFAISKRETYEKLEEAALASKPSSIDTSNVIPDLKRSEKELLNMLRSKA